MYNVSPGAAESKTRLVNLDMSQERITRGIAKECGGKRLVLALFDGLPGESLTSISLEHRMTVRTLAYHITGHILRHLNVIKERYL